jgi:hypothetical protein
MCIEKYNLETRGNAWAFILVHYIWFSYFPPNGNSVNLFHVVRIDGDQPLPTYNRGRGLKPPSNT